MPRYVADETGHLIVVDENDGEIFLVVMWIKRLSIVSFIASVGLAVVLYLTHCCQMTDIEYLQEISETAIRRLGISPTVYQIFHQLNIASLFIWIAETIKERIVFYWEIARLIADKLVNLFDTLLEILHMIY